MKVKKLVFVLVSTLVLLLVLNILCFIAFQIKDKWLKNSNYIAQKYGYPELEKVYQGYTKEELDVLLSETWTREQVFNPETGFAEKPYTGTYLNITENGYRKIMHQTDFPLDGNALNIFCFGGSTMFGYGVADTETIPSYLQEALRAKYPAKNIHVYNFGNAFYFSLQEKKRLEQLLKKGYVPDVAIFMDGLNEFYFGDTFIALTDQQQSQRLDQKLLRFLQHMPVMRLVRSLIYRSTGKIEDNYKLKEDCSSLSLSNKIKRYYATKKQIEDIGNKYNMKTLHIWQPISVYHYAGNEFKSFRESDFPLCGYQLFMSNYYKPQNKLLLLADKIQENDSLNYVDLVHYSPRFNRKIAQAISDSLDLK